MKKTILKIACASLVIFALTNCKKQINTVQSNNSQITSSGNNSQRTLGEQYGVSVENGTLKFSSISNYKNDLELIGNEKDNFLEYIQNLPNFTSQKEISDIDTSTINQRTRCNCAIDDDYVNSIVDVNYMIIINDFLVKLNGCDNKVYALDLLNDDNSVKTQLINCDFSHPTLYKFTFDHVVEEELGIIRDSLNGNPNARGLVCREVAITGRYSSAPAGAIGTSTNVAPAFEVEYSNFGISGTLRTRSFNSSTVTQFTSWKFEFQPAYYRRRCQSTTNINKIENGSISGGTKLHNESQGTRLTNAGGSYQVKVRMVQSFVGGGTIAGPWRIIYP